MYTYIYIQTYICTDLNIYRYACIQICMHRHSTDTNIHTVSRTCLGRYPLRAWTIHAKPGPQQQRPRRPPGARPPGTRPDACTSRTNDHAGSILHNLHTLGHLTPLALCMQGSTAGPRIHRGSCPGQHLERGTFVQRIVGLLGHVRKCQHTLLRLLFAAVLL